MKKIIAVTFAAAIALAATSSAEARDGCGRNEHRGPYGHCRLNGGPIVRHRGPVLVVGNFYHGRGYWDGRRYWQNRYRHHGGWRYR
jgi:hypothetical protein